MENTPPGERTKYLFRAAEEMRKNRFRLMAQKCSRWERPGEMADGDIAEAIDYLEYYAREMKRLSPLRVLGDYPGEQNLYFYEPRGVGAVVSPWNFPIAIPTGMIAAALVTGNVVIFKPSGLSPVCGWNLIEVFKLAGLPPGVLQFMPGPGGEVGEYLVSHAGIDFVAFTRLAGGGAQDRSIGGRNPTNAGERQKGRS